MTKLLLCSVLIISRLKVGNADFLFFYGKKKLAGNNKP